MGNSISCFDPYWRTHSTKKDCLTCEHNKGQKDTYCTHYREVLEREQNIFRRIRSKTYYSRRKEGIVAFKKGTYIGNNKGNTEIFDCRGWKKLK